MHPSLNTGLRVASKIANKINFLKETGRFFRDDSESLEYHLGDLIEMIRAELDHANPTHRIHTDIGRFDKEEAPRQWLIFPPQGVENLMRENYQFALAFMYFEKGLPEASIVIDCAQGEIVCASRQDGARYANIRARVGTCRSLENSIWGVEGHALGKIDALLPTVSAIRTTGVPLLDCLQVGCGRYDGFLALDQDFWALYPALFIVKIAGGMTTDLKANDSSTDSTVFVVSNPKLLPKALKVFNA